jgi:hypothetical protein
VGDFPWPPVRARATKEPLFLRLGFVLRVGLGPMATPPFRIKVTKTQEGSFGTMRVSKTL